MAEFNYKQILDNLIRAIHDEYPEIDIESIRLFEGLDGSEETIKYINTEYKRIHDLAVKNAVRHPGRQIADAGKIMRKGEPETNVG